MACLTDVELQSLADDEGDAASRGHVSGCDSCQARLADRRGQMEQLTAIGRTGGEPPASLEARLRRSVAAAPVRGATALRPAARRSLRPVWVSAAGAVAAAVIIVFAVLPRLDAPATLSASQIIDRSLERMTTGRGVEILEYELVLASTFRQQRNMPEGPFRVYQMVDRSNPGRYRFAHYDQEGVLHQAAAQDPARGRRSELLRVDGRNYIVHVDSPEPLPSLPEIIQAQAESVLRAMQLAADQNLTVLEGPEGRRYVIEMPPLTPSSVTVPLDLHRARVVIDGGDFRVREFTASGILLKQPFDISFKLLQQTRAATIRAEDWEIPVGADDVVIEGEGTGRLDDVMTVVLRELSRAKGR